MSKNTCGELRTPDSGVLWHSWPRIDDSSELTLECVCPVAIFFSRISEKLACRSICCCVGTAELTFEIFSKLAV